MSATVNTLDGIVAMKLLQRPGVALNADTAQRRWFALHDRTAAKVGLDVGVMRGHQAEVTAHRGRSASTSWSGSIGAGHYAVKRSVWVPGRLASERGRVVTTCPQFPSVEGRAGMAPPAP